ncbi:MAG: translation initiation factor 2 [Desulfovibrio sp.]|jgi:hypothetical protein|nr:translation initiation factor 2 [Desulfovibrio sp.]
MNIYIISSFRNLPAVLLLRDSLREWAHNVADFTSLAPPLPDAMTPEERRAALDSDERGRIFSFFTEACASSDLCIYVGPAGQDAACEVGIAWAAGVPVYALTSPLEKPGVILNGCVTRWFTEPALLIDAVQDMRETRTTE